MCMYTVMGFVFLRARARHRGTAARDDDRALRSRSRDHRSGEDRSRAGARGCLRVARSRVGVSGVWCRASGVGARGVGTRRR